MGSLAPAALPDGSIATARGGTDQENDRSAARRRLSLALLGGRPLVAPRPHDLLGAPASISAGESGQ